MEKNNQSVDIKSLSKEQRAALMAQLQQEEKEDRIARRETYEALRGEFMHEVKNNVLEMVNAVTGFKSFLMGSLLVFILPHHPAFPVHRLSAWLHRWHTPSRPAR